MTKPNDKKPVRDQPVDALTALIIRAHARVEETRENAESLRLRAVEADLHAADAEANLRRECDLVNALVAVKELFLEAERTSRESWHQEVTA